MVFNFLDINNNIEGQDGATSFSEALISRELPLYNISIKEIDMARPKKFKFTKEELTKLYIEDKMNTSDISKIYGCGSITIYKALVDFGLNRNSQEYSNLFKRGVPLREETKNKISEIHKGKKKSKSHCKNMSIGRLGISLSKEHSNNISKALRARYKKTPHHLTPIDKEYSSDKNHHDRNSIENVDWRKRIFERDEYTCQRCNKIGHNLNAHHIESFAHNKSIRFEDDNGITLCKECHKEFHSLFGYKSDTKQLNEFLKIQEV